MYKNLIFTIGVIILIGQEGFCQNLIDIIQNNAKNVKQNQIYVPRSNPTHLQVRPILKYATVPVIKYVPVQVPTYPSAIPQGSYRSPPVLFVQKKRSPQTYFHTPVILSNGYNPHVIQYQVPHLNQRSTILYPINYNRAAAVANQNNIPKYTLVNYVNNKTVTKK